MSNEFDNLTLHTDAYEINMMQTYFQAGLQNRRAVFEVYFRKMPFENGFAIYAGLEKVINYIKDINFTDDDIEFLRSQNEYTEEFLEYLCNFKFTGSIR
ncbi:nicotinate phosphoribosyltransferase, partial [Enterococcus lactis]